MEKEQNTAHETVEEKIAKKPVEDAEAEKKATSEEKLSELKAQEKEELSDDEIIDINKEEKKAENSEEKKADNNDSSVTGKSSRKSTPKTTEDFIRKQKKRKKSKVYIVIIIIVAAIVGFIFWQRYSNKKQAEELQNSSKNSVETAIVENKTLYDTKNATGTLYAYDSKTIYANLGNNVAKIEKVNVKVGDPVKIDQEDPLVKFSTENIDKTISDTKEDISIQKQKDSIDAEDAQRNYVYSYTSVANSLETAQKKVDEALFDLHEACDGYGTAKKKRDEIRDMSFEDYKQKYLEKYNLRDASDSVVESAKNSELESLEKEVTNAFQTQEKAQKNYDEAVESQAKTINDSQSGNGSLSSADSTYKKNQLNSGQEVKNLERSLEKSIDSLDDYEVRATINGVVTEVNVTEGNTFSSGNVLTIQDNSRFKAQVLVDEFDIPKVNKAFKQAEAEGRELKVVVKTDATGDKEFAGHVTAIAPTSTSTAAYTTTVSTSSNGATVTTSSSGSTANYKVDVVLDDTDEDLMIGMSTKVAIVVDESPANSICVPYNAVKEGDDGKYYVCVMDENGDHNTSGDMFPGGKGSTKDFGEDTETKDVNGIVVEKEGSDSSQDRPSGAPEGPSGMPGKKSSGISSLIDKILGKTNMPILTGRRYREVEVDKIFETDYYAAVVPKTEGALKVGDEIWIISDSADGTDVWGMFGGMGGGVGGGPGGGPRP